MQQQHRQPWFRSISDSVQNELPPQLEHTARSCGDLLRSGWHRGYKGWGAFTRLIWVNLPGMKPS